MIDFWMGLNKNISDLIFIPSVIAIPKPLFTKISFVTLSIFLQIFLEASQGHQEWLSCIFSSQIETANTSLQTDPQFWFSPWIYGLTKVWRKRYNTDKIHYLVQLSHTFFLSVFSLLWMPLRQWYICPWGAHDYTNSLCFFSVFPSQGPRIRPRIWLEQGAMEGLWKWLATQTISGKTE